MKIKKINNKAIKRIITTSLIIVTSATFTGCAKYENEDINIAIEAPIASAANTNISINYVKKIEPVAESGCDQLLNSLDDKEAVIEDTTEYMLDNMDKMCATDDAITYEELYIASYAYQKLLSSKIDKELFLKELNNMMVEQLLPRSMDENEWLLNFGNLVSTLNEQESLQDTYLVLAYLIHNTNCNEKHTTNECGLIDCKVLQKEFKDKYK